MEIISGWAFRKNWDLNLLELAIIILNYKNGQYVKDCLDSLTNQIETEKHKVILVDNKSPDNSLEVIKKHISKNNYNSWVNIIDAEKNGGFPYGNNIGIKSADSKFYYLLNSDTIVKKDAIKNLLEFAKQNQDYGIISSNLFGLKQEQHRTRFHFHTPISEFIRGANIGLITRALKRWEVPIFDKSAPDWVCFAAVLIKKEVFDKIGLLDEKFFIYYEDTDFCKRAHNERIKSSVCEDSKVVHIMGGTTGQSSNKTGKLPRRPRYLYQSRNYYFMKHYGGIFAYIATNILYCLGKITSFLFSPLRTILRKNSRGQVKTKYKNEILDIWIR